MPKIFSDEEKENLRNRMFLTGFDLLKENGMTHMSVEKITSATGIGKSTFYNFFESKEDFVMQMIEFKRQTVIETLQDKLNGRSKLSAEEGKDLIQSMVFSENSIYRYLSLSDLLLLQDTASYLLSPDSNEETELLKKVFDSIDGIKQEPNYLLIANLMKVIVLAMEDKEQLHINAYEKTMNTLLETLYSCIFLEER